MSTLKHIAFIPDGNRRFGESAGDSAISGHRAGAETIKVVLEEVREQQIPFVTFYIFSTENWKRDAGEVSTLMNLFRNYFLEFKESLDDSIKIKFIGRRDRLPADVLLAMRQIEEKEISDVKMTICFAIDYGGQDELVRAFQKMLWQVFTFQLNPFKINITDVNNALDTAGLPPPDLLVRTSGEQRLSGFLLWQSAYAEIFFADEPWPAFTRVKVKEIITWFNNRKRRFGGN